MKKYRYNYKIKLIEIYCNSVGGDAGKELEIYGNLYFQAGSSKVTLWNVNSKNHVDVREGSFYYINKAYYDISNLTDTKVIFGGHLYEADSSSKDDDMGEGQTYADLVNDVGVVKSLSFSEGNQKVTVSFVIESCTKELFPRGGSECLYEPSKWKDDTFKMTFNSYAYALLKFNCKQLDTSHYEGQISNHIKNGKYNVIGIDKISQAGLIKLESSM